MKSNFLLILCIFTIFRLHSKTYALQNDSLIQKDSTPTLYLICQSHSFLYSHGVLKEGSFLIVKDSMKRSVRGRLHIIDSTWISIQDKNGKKDSFKLNSLQRISTSNLNKKIGAGVLLTIGWSGLIASGILLSTPIENDPYGFKVLSGMALFIVALPIEIIGMRIRMKRYKLSHYNYKILSSTTNELNQNELKKLLDS